VEYNSKLERIAFLKMIENIPKDNRLFLTDMFETYILITIKSLKYEEYIKNLKKYPKYYKLCRTLERT